MHRKVHQHLIVFVIFFVLNLIPHLYISLMKPGVLLNWYLTDDAFYYFKTAQNIVEGNGITFDGISLTNGFHPLWMLVCVPVFFFSRIDLYLPLRFLVVIQGILNAISGYLIYRILADTASKNVGIVLAVFWMFLPSIHEITTKLGLEAGINAVSILLLIFAVSKIINKQTKKGENLSTVFKAGLAAVLCLFSRLDNIFIVGMVGLWIVFAGTQLNRYAMLDFFLIVISSLVSYFLRIQLTDNILNFLPFAYLLVVLSLVLKPLIMYFFGSYGEAESKSLDSILRNLFFSLSIASVFIFLTIYLLFDVFKIFRGYSRSVILLDFLVSVILLGAIRFFRWKKCHLAGCDEGDITLKSNWKDWVVRSMLYFSPVALSLIGYMAFNHFVIGSAMPVSGKIKHWWGKLPNTMYGQPIKRLGDVVGGFFTANSETSPLWTIANLIDWVANRIIKVLGLQVSSAGEVKVFLLIILWISIPTIIFMAVYRYREKVKDLFEKLALPALLVGSFFHILSYKATGYVHARYWYWVSEMVLLILISGVLLGVLSEHLKSKRILGNLINSTLLASIFFSLVLFGFNIFNQFPITGRVEELYDVDPERKFIEKKTQPGDVIGMTGGGLLGYFVPDRTFINLDGLINSPEYFEMMKSDQTEIYFRRIGMDYVYGDEEALLNSDPFRWMFTDRISFLAKGPSFWLYRYCWDSCR